MNTRIFECLIFTSLAIIIKIVSHKKMLRLSAWLLVGFYTTLATETLLRWGVNTQMGVLLLCFVIILAGIVLSGKSIIIVFLSVVTILFCVQWVDTMGYVKPNTKTYSSVPTFGDVELYGTGFAVFALVSWISRRQIEQSLEQVLRAEKALQEEKRMLAVRLDERTQHLRQLQIQEMRQLYKFAELGQLSTAIIHEIANYLTVLMFDLSDIDKPGQHEGAVKRSKESITYLNAIVSQARQRLEETSETSVFDVSIIVKQTIKLLRSKAKIAGVVLSVRSTAKGSLRILGDPLRLSQVITILVSNAIEAYSSPNVHSVVTICLAREGHIVNIAINDRGDGISLEKRSQIFEPFHSTKPEGMGIGLYVAQEMISVHFKGKLELDKRTDRTRFIVAIPMTNSQ